MRLVLLSLLLPLSRASAQQYAIALPKMNACYIGIDNPVSAAAFGCAPAALTLTTDNGELKRTGDDWIYRPASPGKGTISAYKKSGRDSVLLGKAVFRIKPIPKPRPTLAGKSTGSIYKGVLLAQVGIIAYIESFDFEARAEVVSYDFNLLRAGGGMETIHCTGALFSPEILALIQTAKAGDMVLVEAIKVRVPGNVVYDADPIRLQIG